MFHLKCKETRTLVSVRSVKCICIMLHGQIKGYHQCYKFSVTWLTTGYDTAM